MLPKMTREQLGIISKRLAHGGFSVELFGSLSARSGQGAIHVDPSGVCRSSIDITDLIIPAVPDILACEKARVPIGELVSVYLAAGKSGKKTRVRISTRTESTRLWDFMRASGGCGLSPDEHAFVTFLLGRADGSCEVLTDFPEELSVPRVLGGRRYFDSRISPALAAETLRVAGTKSRRNSYLSRHGMLGFGHYEEPSAPEWFDLFDRLGEWCFFAPE